VLPAPTYQISWPPSNTQFMLILSEIKQNEHDATPQEKQAILLLDK